MLAFALLETVRIVLEEGDIDTDEDKHAPASPGWLAGCIDLAPEAATSAVHAIWLQPATGQCLSAQHLISHDHCMPVQLLQR